MSPRSNVVHLARASSGDSGGEDDGELRERVAALEAHFQHLATKAWVLGGVLGGMGIAPR